MQAENNKNVSVNLSKVELNYSKLQNDGCLIEKHKKHSQKKYSCRMETEQEKIVFWDHNWCLETSQKSL